MATTFVIARYSENLDWIQSLSPILKQNTRFIIYNKGKPLAKDIEDTDLCVLPNIGRESHTYLTHIVTNYERIIPGEFTVFTQGGVNDHSMIQFRCPNINSLFLTMKVEAFKYGISRRGLLRGAIPQHFRLKEWPKGCILPPNKHGETFDQWYVRYLKKPYNHLNIEWIPSSIFTVRNENILRHPKSYYEELLREFDDSSNPEVGHFFERAFYSIFSQ